MLLLTAYSISRKFPVFKFYQFWKIAKKINVLGVPMMVRKLVTNVNPSIHITKEFSSLFKKEIKDVHYKLIITLHN